VAPSLYLVKSFCVELLVGRRLWLEPIEEHYAAVREGIPEGPRELLRDYTNQGRLGVKSGRGFYDYGG
jgi:3-hydroxyacyl-CoA dehydrogenase